MNDMPIRRPAFVRGVLAHRRDHDTIAQRQAPDVQGGEQLNLAHLDSSTRSIVNRRSAASRRVF